MPETARSNHIISLNTDLNTRATHETHEQQLSEKGQALLDFLKEYILKDPGNIFKQLENSRYNKIWVTVAKKQSTFFSSSSTCDIEFTKAENGWEVKFFTYEGSHETAVNADQFLKTLDSLKFRLNYDKLSDQLTKKLRSKLKSR